MGDCFCKTLLAFELKLCVCSKNNNASRICLVKSSRRSDGLRVVVLVVVVLVVLVVVVVVVVFVGVVVVVVVVDTHLEL